MWLDGYEMTRQEYVWPTRKWLANQDNGLSTKNVPNRSGNGWPRIRMAMRKFPEKKYDQPRVWLVKSVTNQPENGQTINGQPGMWSIDHRK